MRIAPPGREPRSIAASVTSYLDDIKTTVQGLNNLGHDCSDVTVILIIHTLHTATLSKRFRTDFWDHRVTLLMQPVAHRMHNKDHAVTHHDTTTEFSSDFRCKF